MKTTAVLALAGFALTTGVAFAVTTDDVNGSISACATTRARQPTR